MDGDVTGALSRRLWLLALATLPLAVLAVWDIRVQGLVAGLNFAQWHALLEFASMAVCAVIAIVAWNGRALETTRSVHMLGMACVGALVLDLAHTLSFPGLAEHVTTEGLTTPLALFIAGRLLIAVSLLAVAAMPWRMDQEPPWLRRAPAAVAVYVLGMLVWVYGWPETLPALLVDGESLTLAKRVAEYTVAALFFMAALLFARRLKSSLPLDVWPLLSGAVLMAFGGLCLTLYTRVTDLAYLVGHLYKLAGFWLIYRTIVTDSFRAPYQRLVASEQRLRASEDELRTVTDNIPAMVAFVDLDQRYRFVNRNYERWVGVAPEQIIGRTALELFGEHYAPLQEGLERALAGQASSVEHHMTGDTRAHGRWLSVMYLPKRGDDGQVSGVYVFSHDITDIVAAQGRALFLAEHDELTMLPNRVAFQAAVSRALLSHEANPESGQFAVIFVDVDRFKVINDTLGHATGDHLLQALALRMKQVVRGQDLVARMGGDEMCLLLHDVRDAAHAGEIAERILTALRAPVELRSGMRHHVTVSAGIAVFPHDGTDVDTLLRHADIAMYRAKEAGRDGFRLFSAHEAGPAEERMALELALRTAIDDNQLVLHYQPRVDVGSGRLTGMEALVRWQHPQRGLLAPAHFIDIAEETGLIVPMGAWVMREAGQAMRRMLGQHAGELTMSVNVSARQFRNPRLVAEVGEMIALAGCAPHQIELELTESAVMEHPEMAEATMRELKSLGVRLAMDDFGTGHSSLAALKRFPMDCVKIDRSFVGDIPADLGDAALTRAIIAMGHSLGLHVVAEGVERSDQLDFLRREGCDEYQGYFFAKPLPEATLLTLLTQPRCDAQEEHSPEACAFAAAAG